MYYFDLQHFMKVSKYVLRDHDRYTEGRDPGSVRDYKRGALSKEGLTFTLKREQTKEGGGG